MTEVLTSGMVNGSFLATSSSGLIAVARFGGVVFLDGSVLAEDMVGLCAKVGTPQLTLLPSPCALGLINCLPPTGCGDKHGTGGARFEF